jgi:biotin operon repressor
VTRDVGETGWYVLAALTYRPRTLDAIANSLGLTRREVEKAVQALRAAGEPIVTTGHGVHLTADPDELERCVAALQRRTLQQYATVRALRMTARAMRARRTPSYQPAERPELWR